MIDVSPEIITLLMFIPLLVCILLGYPLALALGGIGMAVSLIFQPPEQTFAVFYNRIWGVMIDYTFLAVPLFIFMGLMLEQSGVSERLFGAIYLWMGPIPGGLAVATVLLGTILAAAVGIIGASVVMLGLIALPAMHARGYKKELACGSICAGGTLGILIPPSVMLVIYGPVADIGVGLLFMAAFIPGFLLSALYIGYILTACLTHPDWGPAAPPEERQVPLSHKLNVLIKSLLPTLSIIFAVLGTIFLGIAAPTEAASVGAIATAVLCAAYRRLDLQVLKGTLYQTIKVTSMVMIIAMCAGMFTSTFLGLGCGKVVENAVLSIPFGRWGSFIVIQLIVFTLGMFIDWIGIIFIMIPLVTPIGEALGFNKLWFAMMIIINLQMSFMTPPFAYALFYLRGITKEEWGIETNHIVRGVIPFVLLVMAGLILCILFPDIILGLPKWLAMR
ncbi:MAG: C4-dicarboxylate ABC transporter [Deltaproteobacteria bacterium SM23_61]|nr:MAG: C4-dicarboxylate ABC transporter [Deltaproteobacteria bacterium SM23_61]